MDAWRYVSRQIYFGPCYKAFGSWLNSLRQDGISQARCGLPLFCFWFSIGFTQGRKIEAAGQGVGLSRMEMAESCVPSVKIVSWCVNSGLLDQKNKHQICSWVGQLHGSSMELPFTNSRFSGPQDRDGQCWNTAARGTGQVLIGITGTLLSELRVPRDFASPQHSYLGLSKHTVLGTMQICFFHKRLACFDSSTLIFFFL